LLRSLGWGKPKATPEAFQKQVFRELNPEEEQVVNFLENRGTASFDVILRETSLTTNQLSNTLLMLEMEGIVSALSGKRYLLS
jgi:DNA processing protein